MKKPKIIRCPYCGGTAILRDASFVYGTHSHGGQVYVCLSTIHPAIPMSGTSGNQDTKRNARQPGASSKADSGTSNFRSDLATGASFPNRKHIAGWQKFCLTDKQAHIGQFSNYMCDQLIRESADVLKNNHIPFRLRAAS